MSLTCLPVTSHLATSTFCCLSSDYGPLHVTLRWTPMTPGHSILPGESLNLVLVSALLSLHLPQPEQSHRPPRLQTSAASGFLQVKARIFIDSGTCPSLMTFPPPTPNPALSYSCPGLKDPRHTSKLSVSALTALDKHSSARQHNVHRWDMSSFLPRYAIHSAREAIALARIPSHSFFTLQTNKRRWPVCVPD